jgi:hypothetical protein
LGPLHQAGRTRLRLFYQSNRSDLSIFEQIHPGTTVAATGISVPPAADSKFEGYQLRLRHPTDLAIRPARGEASPRDPD